MNRLFLLLLFASFMAGCGGEDLPKDVMPASKMETVLWDVLRADELTNQYIMVDSSYASLEKHAELYHYIFQAHGISKAQFVRSLRFYQSRPDLLKPVLDSLMGRGKQLQPQKADLKAVSADSAIKKITDTLKSPLDSFRVFGRKKRSDTSLRNK